jgi:hypothetical protein
MHKKVRESFGPDGGIGEAKVLTLAATFSVSTLKPKLQMWLQLIASPYCIEVAPCSLPHRYLIDPEHGLTRHCNGLHVILFRLDDWNNFGDASSRSDDIHPESRKMVERNLRLTIEAIEAAADMCFGSVALVLCPLTREHYQSDRVRDYFASVASRLSEVITGRSQYALLNAERLIPESELECGDFENSGPPYPEPFVERLSRRIAQTCYAMESRPWTGLVLSPGGHGITDSLEWRDFISYQWRCGRRVALASDHPLSTRDECYAATDFSPVPAWQKIPQLARELLTSEQDLIFLGRASECREIEERIPHMLALPIFDREWNWADALRELWCLQPIPEVWFSALDVPKPTLPRLSGPILLGLAAHPELPPSAFLPNS